jgi:hypothetical protein
MATDVQFSVTSRNAQLDAIETEAGVSAVLKIRSGARPATCATADAGTVLASMTLPSDWMGAAAAGAKALAGTWQDLLADATGTAGHWRLYKSDGTTCCAQGDCSLPGAGGSLELINTSLAINQPVSVTAFTLTAGGV